MERLEDIERVERRRLPWPELTLIVVTVIIILVVTFQSSTPSCHHWKQRINDVSSAFMGAAGTEEHPASGRPIETDQTGLTQAARQVLDDRPFACL
jgi:hypothetical protein